MHKYLGIWVGLHTKLTYWPMNVTDLCSHSYSLLPMVRIRDYATNMFTFSKYLSKTF